MTTFLQGTVTTFQVLPNPNELGWRSLFGAWYFEDAIKLRPNLTIQAGIRHEFTTGWNEDSGRAANYITDSTGVLLTAPRVGDSAFTQNNAKRLFSPRVSLAWDPFGDGKMAVRAGFGTYYSLIDALSFLLNSLPPTNGSVSYSNASLFSLLPVSSGRAAGSLVRTRRAPALHDLRAARRAARRENANRGGVELHRRTATRQKLVAARCLCGSHGYHGLLSVDPNTIPAQVCSNASRVPNGWGGDVFARHGAPGRAVHSASEPGPIPTWALDSSGTPKATAVTTPCKPI